MKITRFTSKTTLTCAYLVPLIAGLHISVALSAPQNQTTFCNPIDLPYRFQPAKPNRREAADPSMVSYKGEWWLFASKSGGYWHTKDFLDWKFVEPTGLPIEEYAPTVEIIDGKLHFSASGNAIYTTDDPLAGKWTKVSDLHGAPDTNIFRDTDGRVYLYYGCSDRTPIWGEELDPKQSFKTIQGPVDLIAGKREIHGWEAKRKLTESANLSDDMQSGRAPWVEGSWMTKVGSRYYLQYAAPGTELDTYADGVYVGNSPLGPFTYQSSNPFSYKPTGFLPGAGHGSTFQDGIGNYWHIASSTISKLDIFERRLSMFPTQFFPDSQLASNTYLGDYPQYRPGAKSDPFKDNSPGWMLLSLNKPMTASSSLPDFPANLAGDENIKTWWSAATGYKGEWLQVDLGNESKINAVQVNFADQGSTSLGRIANPAYKYTVEVSNNGKVWKSLIDKSQNQRDAPHDYTQLEKPVMGRYVRLTNVYTPGNAMFAVSGLRVFGNGMGAAPSAVKSITTQRDQADGRLAKVSWTPAKGAEFYVVRYGVRPDRLFSNYQVYGATNLDINALNAGVPYYVTVDAINASGIKRGPAAIAIK